MPRPGNGIGFPLSRHVAGVILALSAALPAGCSTPFHMSDAHVTSAVPSSSLDIAVLACEPVTTFGLVAPAGLQGLSPTVSHALTTALSGASPPVRAMPMPELVNRLTDQELAGEYATMLSDVARTGIRSDSGSGGSAPRSAHGTCCNRGSPTSIRSCSTSLSLPA